MKTAGLFKLLCYKPIKSYNHIVIIVLMLVCIGCTSPSVTDHLTASEFKNPPSSVHVHTWWHWIDGRITREGITKDLESMKQQGITQATILNVSMFAGKDPGVDRITFNTEQWYEMFRWALTEANRLGIHIGVHNCDGWSESGGPWITPEMSMKKFVYTKTAIDRKQAKILLQQPLSEKNFYRDVAVIAYRTNQAPTQPQNVKIAFNDTLDGSTLQDDNPESMIKIFKNDYITFCYPEATTKSKVAILLNFKGSFYFPGPKKIRYSVFASSDGKNYKKAGEFETNKFYVTEILDIPATKAKYFKIEVSEIFNLRPWHHAAVAELELLGDTEEPLYRPTIAYPLEKIASARIIKPEVLYTSSSGTDVKNPIPKNDVINITDKMAPDGTLKWDVPEGNWTVIRFGYTTNGAQNGPATPEGTGLECDKMDTSAVNLHFQNFPQKLITQAGSYKGNTFKFLMIDSWERGYQTWTNAMPEEFEKRRGYRLTQWIPALCGETVESTSLSDGFLYDFRKTVADLFEQNYYGHFRDLCHRNGIELHGEVIYGDTGPFPPLDVLKTNSYMDMPMFEFWAIELENDLVKYKPSKNLLVNFPALTSIFYNNPVIGAEAYTGYARYSESPSDLKLFGDQAYCSGINQMILHSYVHQPTDKMPGFTLGQHGSHFNRNNPWWQYSKGWLDYQSRVQYVLQKGKISADILYYLGDQRPQFLENSTVSNLPENYKAIPCNYDILQKLTVEKGKLHFAEGQEYSILILPDRKTFDYTALQKIAQLVKDGATVYGEKPQYMFSLPEISEQQQQFTELTDQLWNTKNQGGTRNKYGKGIIIWNEPITDVLSELQMVPDFTTNTVDSLNIMYIRKNTEDTDVFFVVNQQDQTLNRECLFRTEGKVPERWNPLTGETEKIAIYSIEQKQVRIPVSFKPRESLFFIFRKGDSGKSIQKVELGEIQLFPAKDMTNLSNPVPDAVFGEDGNFEFKSYETGTYTFTTSDGKTFTSVLKTPETREIENFDGKIVFSPVNHGKIDSVEISNLQSYSEFQEPAIKYFAGTATYRIDFDLPKTYFNNCASVYLNLGNIETTAKVYLNNQFVQNCWMSNSWMPVNDLLKEKNHLEIVIANTCRNRIIGDFIEYGYVQSLWTTASVGSFLNKNSPLKPSGVIGPLQLIKYTTD